MNKLKNKETDRIKQEDKKALKGFALIMLASFVIGAVMGGVTAFADHFVADDFGTIFSNIMSGYVYPYGIPVVTLVIMVIVIVLYRKAKNIFVKWDGEEEEIADKADIYLSYGLWLTSINMIWNYFIFGAACSNSMWVKMQQGGGMKGVLALVIFFMLSLVVMSVEQQKLVNLTKQFNPEKQGSVFDTKFKKKWEESCDEAELMMTYKCAYRAYSAVQYTCIGLWLVCLLGNFMWDFGAMPVAMITIIWGVMTTVYCFESIKLSKKKNK